LIPYVKPEYNLSSFNCPNCNSYSDQTWTPLYVKYWGGGSKVKEEFHVSCCRSCQEIAIWQDTKMIFPKFLTAPTPHEDMPKSIKPDYEEAREIASPSPRSACALLRLCIEKLCNELVGGGGDLNDKIKKLVEKGLDTDIQKALDTVRVIGGEAVHPLEMDLKDDAGTANSLFEIVNIIIESTISKTKKVKAMYDKLPEKKKKAIEDRDKKK